MIALYRKLMATGHFILTNGWRLQGNLLEKPKTAKMISCGSSFRITATLLMFLFAGLFLFWFEMAGSGHLQNFQEQNERMAEIYKATYATKNYVYPQGDLHISKDEMDNSSRMKRRANAGKESDSLVNVLRVLDIKLDSKPGILESRESNHSLNSKVKRLKEMEDQAPTEELKKGALDSTTRFAKAVVARKEESTNGSKLVLAVANITSRKVTRINGTSDERKGKGIEGTSVNEMINMMSSSQSLSELELGYKNDLEGNENPHSKITVEIKKINQTDMSRNESTVNDIEENVTVKVHTVIQGREDVFQYTIPLTDEASFINITVNGSSPQRPNGFNMCKGDNKETIGEIRPEVFVSSTNIKGSIGKNIEIECNATGEPIPILKWQKVAMRTSKRQVISKRNRSVFLDIQNASIGDGGAYICSAENRAGKDWKIVSLRFVEKDCSAWRELGYNESGIYTISPDDSPPFDVYCDMKTGNRGWVVIQRRVDGTVDFFRSWTEYKNGFGNMTGEFWLGNDRIRRLTKKGDMMIRFDIQDSAGRKAYAEYRRFYIDDEQQKYALRVESYNGTAGDSLTYHNGAKFSTKDSNNDLYRLRCAQRFRGAWWFRTCLRSNLNGAYAKGSGFFYGAEGIKWLSFNHRQAVLVKTEMKITPFEP